MYKFCFNIHTNEITHTLSLDSSQGAREVKKHLSLTQHKLTEASLEGEVWPRMSILSGKLDSNRAAYV